MAQRTVTTKFDLTDLAYVLAEARDHGHIARGRIKRIQIDIGSDGYREPRIWYALDNNAVFQPPGGWWEEYELGTEAEAAALAATYNEVRAAYHKNRADRLGS